MQVTERIHAIKIPFKVPLSSEISIDRFAFIYLVFGDNIHVIDSGVAGAESILRDYIQKQGREPREIVSLILTHSHPDHIGAAKSIKKQSGCTIFAHKLEQGWIEDIEQQFKARPIPGFHDLVEGSVEVDNLVDGGQLIQLEKNLTCEIIHTPGHSQGLITLLFKDDHALFTADALAFPGDLPIYEDIFNCIASIRRLQNIPKLNYLFSSWEDPIQGREKISKRMDESIAYLQRIHSAVLTRYSEKEDQDILDLCKKVVQDLGLPPFAGTPLVAKAFASSLDCPKMNTGRQNI